MYYNFPLFDQFAKPLSNYDMVQQYSRNILSNNFERNYGSDIFYNGSLVGKRYTSGLGYDYRDNLGSPLFNLNYRW